MIYPTYRLKDICFINTVGGQLATSPYVADILLKIGTVPLQLTFVEREFPSIAVVVYTKPFVSFKYLSRFRKPNSCVAESVLQTLAFLSML